MSLLEQILPRLRNVLDAVHGLTKGLLFEHDNQQHLLAGALLGRVLEEAEGVCGMLDRRDSACGFILLRSLLEAYVDLLNITSDPAYANFMRAAFLDQQRQLLEIAIEKGSKSAFLAGLPGNEEAAEQLRWVRSELKQLKDQKIQPLRIRQRFERAKKLDYYEGPYAQLCWHSHNNVNILESRHLKLKGDGYEIRAFVPIGDDDAQLISDTTAGISANSVAAVKELLEGEPVTGLEDLTAALTRFRDLWSGR